MRCTSVRRAVFFLLALSLVEQGLRAAPQTPAFAEVRILNTTGDAGRAMADVVLPCRRGAVRAAPSLVTDRGKLCAVRVMGARWPDGSVRYLKLDLPVDVTPNESRRVRLFVNHGAGPVFRAHAAVTALVPKIRTWLRTMSKRAEFGVPVLVEDGPRVRVYRSRVRLENSCVYAELHTLFMHDTPHVRFYLEWGNSNPDRPQLHENPGAVAFEVQGATVVFDEAAMKLHGHYDLPGGVRGFVLHLGGWIADGQAHLLEGRILAGGGAPRVRAMALGWAQSGAFGPFGELIPEIGVDTKWFAETVAYEDRKQALTPWAAPVHGCNPNPSNTGNQPDFGTIAMRPDVLLGSPARLRLIARSVFQEWCRPTHFRERNVSPVTQGNHPRLLLLSGRPHFPEGPGVDLLGKKADYLDDKKIAADEQGRTYRGHDSEHLSINYLVAFAMTTGDRAALLECEHHAEMWLGEFTYNTGHANDAPGAARAVGRSMLAASWLWLLTARQDLARRVTDRARSLVSYFIKARKGESALLPAVLVPRWDSERGWYWPPWEEAIAAVGLAGVYVLFGSQEAAAVSEVICGNIVRNGIGFTKSGWRVGYNIPFATPRGHAYRALLDPNFAANQAAGTGLTQWTMPAVVLTARYSRNAGDRALATAFLADLIRDRNVSWDPDILEWIPVVPRHVR